VEENYKHPKMKHASTEQPMDLDVYMEELKLAFEYQGQQHYEPVYGLNTDLETQRIKDREKREACKEVQFYFLSSLLLN